MTYWTIKYGPGHGAAANFAEVGNGWAALHQAASQRRQATLYVVHPNGTTDRLGLTPGNGKVLPVDEVDFRAATVTI